MVRMVGYDPTTSCFQNKHSTRLSYTLSKNGAPNETRTRIPQVESLLLYSN